MTEENKIILINRLKSLAWRIGAFVVVASLEFVADNLGLINLPGEVQVIVALILGEITKYLNTKLTR